MKYCGNHTESTAVLPLKYCGTSSIVLPLCYSFFFKVKKKVTPFPGLLLADICPLWKLTPFLTIDNPNPVPPILRLRPLSTR